MNANNKRRKQKQSGSYLDSSHPSMPVGWGARSFASDVGYRVFIFTSRTVAAALLLLAIHALFSLNRPTLAVLLVTLSIIAAALSIA